MGELVGMYVGVWGSTMWVSDIVLHNSSRGGIVIYSGRVGSLGGYLLVGLGVMGALH